MDGNFLQMLGLQSPGIVSDDFGGYGAGPTPAPVAPPAPAMPPQNTFQALNPAPAPVAPDPAVALATRPARARSSLLDTVGRLADVFAKVGGADPLYQPTLDARQDRVLALGDHDRSVDMDKLKKDLARLEITTDQGKIDDAGSARLKQTMLRLQAITEANPNADVSQVWPILAQQAGIPADHAAAIGQAISSNPDFIKGFAADTADDKEKYGGSIVYGTDKDGNLVAFQPGLGSNEGRNIMPAGMTPLDPQKFVNLGGVTAAMGSHTGRPTTILPNSEAPGKAADRRSREGIAAGRNATAIQIAGMPARGKAGSGIAESSMAGANMLLDNIERGFKDLHGMGALAGDNSGAVGNVLGAIGRTRVGQAIGEQAGNSAAQRRLLMEKDINSLQSEMVKSLPASATRTKFEQEIQRRRLPDPHRMDYKTGMAAISDLRRSFAQAQRDAQAELARKGGTRTPVRPVLRSPAAARPAASPGKPTVSNW